jgi:hypothetical protein
MDAVTTPTIEQIATEAMVYPDHVLEGAETALALFSAAFQGRNDIIHLAIAGLHVTLVDNQLVLLEQMRGIYPDDWSYIHADAYQYAEHAQGRWDIVAVDPWTNQFQKCADFVRVWCRLAERAVILGTGEHTILSPPDGWQETERVWRSDYAGGVYWAVIQPA